MWIRCLVTSQSKDLNLALDKAEIQISAVINEQFLCSFSLQFCDKLMFTMY